jgi:hypothetical protein
VTDELKQTVRIVRNAKIATDDRGQSVWVDPIETAELELVTTTMLKRVLNSDDERKKQQIREAADGKDGILVHDPDLDRFAIIDDADLHEAIAATAGAESTRAADVTFEAITRRADGDDEELSLVSTQALRRILHIEPEQDDDVGALDEGGGFDPYNRS